MSGAEPQVHCNGHVTSLAEVVSFDEVLPLQLVGIILKRERDLDGGQFECVRQPTGTTVTERLVTVERSEHTVSGTFRRELEPQQRQLSTNTGGAAFPEDERLLWRLGLCSNFRDQYI